MKGGLGKMRRSMMFLLAVCFVFLAPLARAEETSRHTLRFPVTDWQPFTIGKEAPFGGIDVDIAREVAKRLNFNLDLRACPFRRCLRLAEMGAIDMMSGIAFNEKRGKYLNYLRERPYGKVAVAFYVRTGQAELISTYEDLHGYTVGMVRGSHYFDPFNTDETVRKYQAATEAALLPMLAGERLSVIVGTNPNLDYQILKAGYKGQFEAAHYDPQQEVPIYFALSRKSPLQGYKHKIAAVFDDMRADGTFEVIYSKYK